MSVARGFSVRPGSCPSARNSEKHWEKSNADRTVRTAAALSDTLSLSRGISAVFLLLLSLLSLTSPPTGTITIGRAGTRAFITARKLCSTSYRHCSRDTSIEEPWRVKRFIYVRRRRVQMPTDGVRAR